MARDKDHIIKLTLAVYKITDKFLPEEPLKFKIREKASEILAILFGANPSSSKKDKEKLLAQINILEAYFHIAQNQNWVDPKNFLILGREYRKIKESFSGFSKRKRSFPQKKENNLRFPPEIRQQKILNILEKKGEVSLEELKESFPQVCSRTLRRDLKALMSQNNIQRIRNGKKDVIFKLETKIDSGQIFPG
jgi:hypothetical protein